MIACASAGGVSGPKFIVPRQRRLTDRPERPKLTYSMRLAFHGGTAIHLAMSGLPHVGEAQIPAGGACRSASSTARARPDEVRNHSPDGASSLLSTCTCQP